MGFIFDTKKHRRLCRILIKISRSIERMSDVGIEFKLYKNTEFKSEGNPTTQRSMEKRTISIITRLYFSNDGIT